MPGKIKLALLTAVLLLLCASCRKTEDAVETYTYSINKTWWSDSIDTNLDGYATSKRLNIDVHVRENLTRTINARVFYKLHEASSFTFYAYMGNKNAQGGNKTNNFFVQIGTPNKELARGLYDFKIEVFESNNGKTVVSSNPNDTTVLAMQKFEESASDKNYSIRAWWSDKFDRNGNGYLRYARLNIDVNVDTALRKNIYTKLYYKNSSDNVYQSYYQFPGYSIFGKETSDTVSCIVGTPMKELLSGTYDFKIEVYETGSNVLVAMADEADTVLNDVKFESEEDDSFTYTVSKVWWSEQVDVDGDGYTQSRKLNFKVDVDKNANRTIYAKIFYMPPDSSDYTMCDSSENFNIAGTSSGNNYSVSIGGTAAPLDSTVYDFLISIYEPVADSVEAFQVSVSGSTDTTLSKQKFENPKTDIKK